MTPALQEEVSRGIADALLLDAGYELPARRAAEVEYYRHKPLRELSAMVASAIRTTLDWNPPDSWSSAMNAPAFADALLRFLQTATVAEFQKLGDSATAWLRPKQVERFTETSFYLKFSGLSTLSKVGSGGMPDHTLLLEDSRTRNSDTYASLYLLPRQSWVGQDPSYFFSLPTHMALEARRCLDDLVIAALSENSNLGPTMAEDGLPLFDTTRSTPNRMTGGASALAKSSLATAATLLRAITSEDGKTLKLKPKFLVVPAALEQTALQVRSEVGLGATVIASQMPATESPVASLHPGPLNIVVLPALDDLSATAWYLGAARDVQCIELLSLWTPSPMPSVAPVKTERLALQWGLTIDAGIATPDWRTMVRSDGA